MKAYLIVNTNMYCVKRYFTQKLALALEGLGVDVRILDTEEKQLSIANIEEIRQFQPDFIASFNSQIPLPDGKFFWDYLNIPFVALLVDAAVYSMYLFSSPNVIFSYIDEADKALLAASKVEHAFFWPHAADHSIELKEKKEYDVVFCGSFYDHRSLKRSWQERFPSEVIAALDRAVNLFSQDRRLSLIEAVWQALVEQNIPLTEVDFAEVCFQVDYYIRGKDRLELLLAIDKSEVHLFGSTHEETEFGRGWAEELETRSNIILHPELSFAETIEVLQKSKIALNSSPSFKHGAHERIFTAMMAGAAVVTNESLWLEREFAEDERLTYQLKNKTDLDASVRSLLRDEKRRSEMALKARQKVLSHHTFHQRARALLDAVIACGVASNAPFDAAR